MMLIKHSVRYILGIAFLLQVTCLNAQETKLDEGVLNYLKEHISALASDKFEGRETGTKGEALAAKYIIKQFKTIGLKPLGEKGYLQEFTFDDGIEYGEDDQLVINNTAYKIGEDFYPLPYAVEGKVKGSLVNVGFGITAPSLDYDDYKDMKQLEGKIFVIELSSPDGVHPHSKYIAHSNITKKIEHAVDRGAAGIVFINSDTILEDPIEQDQKTANLTVTKVPVIFAKGEAYKALVDAQAGTINIDMALKKIERTGKNVIGYIDNGADNTVVFGAHYDHLGYGDHGSTDRDGKRAIHNGADDNASGTAGLIELSRHYKYSDKKNNNYLFIAFSAEEKGLVGSKHFTNNPTIKLESINYMINMDMIGRLRNDEKYLSILGVGTSSDWENFSNIQVDGIMIKSVKSGVGPGDYTVFYLKDIPALSFFSGAHKDYHKPSDDEDKINYQGEVSIIKYIVTFIDQMDDNGKIAFTKTKDKSHFLAGNKKPRVSLGIIPDYVFSAGGVKVEAAMDERPASEAGIQRQDIIIKIGDMEILDMGSYMKAMTLFKKGEKAKVKLKRGEDLIELEVTF